MSTRKWTATATWSDGNGKSYEWTRSGTTETDDPDTRGVAGEVRSIAREEGVPAGATVKVNTRGTR